MSESKLLVHKPPGSPGARSNWRLKCCLCQFFLTNYMYSIFQRSWQQQQVNQLNPVKRLWKHLSFTPLASDCLQILTCKQDRNDCPAELADSPERHSVLGLLDIFLLNDLFFQVMQHAQKEFLNFAGVGFSVMGEYAFHTDQHCFFSHFFAVIRKSQRSRYKKGTLQIMYMYVWFFF